MRLCTKEDIPRLEVIYAQAIEHAESLEGIDWPRPFPVGWLDAYISEGELFGFEEHESGLVAVIRLSDSGNDKIWSAQERNTPALYMGKTATANSVRGRNFRFNVMQPEIIEYARSRGIGLLREDTVATNVGLAKLNEVSGRVNVGNVTFYSELQGRELSVTKWELKIQALS